MKLHAKALAGAISGHRLNCWTPREGRVFPALAVRLLRAEQAVLRRIENFHAAIQDRARQSLQERFL